MTAYSVPVRDKLHDSAAGEVGEASPIFGCETPQQRLPKIATVVRPPARVHRDWPFNVKIVPGAINVVAGLGQHPAQQWCRDDLG